MSKLGRYLAFTTMATHAAGEGVREESKRDLRKNLRDPAKPRKHGKRFKKVH